jgi:hypothetical protein
MDFIFDHYGTKYLLNDFIYFLKILKTIFRCLDIFTWVIKVYFLVKFIYYFYYHYYLNFII